MIQIDVVALVVLQCKLKNINFAKAAGAPKAAMIKDTKAQIVSAECSACRMQITNSLHLADVNIQFRNPIELISEALEEA